MDFQKDKLLPMDYLIIFGIIELSIFQKNIGILELAKKLKITPQYLIKRTKVLESQGYIKREELKQKGKQGRKVILNVSAEAQQYFTDKLQDLKVEVVKTSEEEGYINTTKPKKNF